MYKTAFLAQSFSVAAMLPSESPFHSSTPPLLSHSLSLLLGALPRAPPLLPLQAPSTPKLFAFAIAPLQVTTTGSDQLAIVADGFIIAVEWMIEYCLN